MRSINFKLIFTDTNTTLNFRHEPMDCHSFQHYCPPPKTNVLLAKSQHQGAVVNYVRMKSAIIDAERKHGLLELDPTTREILTSIAEANLLSRSIRISDIVQEGFYGTLPTVYSKLKKLVDGGWIERTADTADGRAVLLHITPKTRTIFKRISNIVETL